MAGITTRCLTQTSSTQLLADDFAANGLKVSATATRSTTSDFHPIQTVILDYFHGDPIPADALNPGKTFSIPDWLSNHTQENTRPTLDKVVEALKSAGVTEFAATGYCFGGIFWFQISLITKNINWSI